MIVGDDCVHTDVQDVDAENVNVSEFMGPVLPESPLTSAYVNKQISKALGSKYHMTKEAKAGVENAAQMFLMMVSSVSSDYAGRHKRRHVVQKSDVREALEKMNLSHLTDRVDKVSLASDNGLKSHVMHGRDKEKKPKKRTSSRSNPYCNFIKQEIPKLKLVFPTYNLPLLAKEAAKKWSQLNADEKKSFQE
ncbi:DNA polymerase epsilon subunit 3-like protein [Perkinsela sp. CCAP 1560/4]|nr:DNA polymerase epsilon subunit 3-like protein [Perkinsela sp. CCAP 1560/4]|eukprot:KNH08033.1 DNA polymerase epsilon subunit 3-like protein [Perkinsela sp. CCAP 1560/4]